jgi:alkylhydroperoxidase family enzyme
LQGETYSQAAEALRAGDLDAAGLDRPHRLLLEFVETITRHAYRVTDEQVQGLRDAGWSDEQIAEAAYDAALFNLFVRLADTFDIEPPAAYEPNGIPAAAARPSGPGKDQASLRSV